jgi:hypothetical protein
MNLTEYDYLCHHGILGMKWGVRRYQNKNGSLTAEGRARYGGEKAEKYRAKLIKNEERKAKGILLSEKSKNNHKSRIAAIKQATNEDIAKMLLNKRKAQIGGGALGAGLGLLKNKVSPFNSYSAKQLLTNPEFKKGGTTVYDKRGVPIYSTGKTDIERVAIPLAVKFSNVVVTPVTFGLTYGHAEEKKEIDKLVKKYGHLKVSDM